MIARISKMLFEMLRKRISIPQPLKAIERSIDRVRLVSTPCRHMKIQSPLLSTSQNVASAPSLGICSTVAQFGMVTADDWVDRIIFSDLSKVACPRMIV